jgi:hypothetical protein
MYPAPLQRLTLTSMIRIDARRPGPRPHRQAVPWPGTATQCGAPGWCRNRGPARRGSSLWPLLTRQCRSLKAGPQAGCPTLPMVDRRLHDDLRKIYLHLKAPRFDLHRRVRVRSLVAARAAMALMPRRCALLSWNESLPLIQLLGWMKQISQNSRLIDGSDGSNAIMILGHGSLGTRAAAPPGPPAFKLRPARRPRCPRRRP